MHNKKLLILLAFLIFFLGQIPHHQLPCCNDSNPAKPFGGTLTIGQITRPATLNPLLEYSGVSAQFIDIVFDGLIDITEKGEIQPCLAASWKIGDGGRKWTFHLRKGVRFHDGQPFTAADVAFTINLLRDPHLRKGYSQFYQQITKVEARDPYTIDIHLISPSASFIYGLVLGIVPRHLLQGRDIHNTPFNYQPIGTGPFRLTQWSPDRLEFEANQDYFLGRPYLDRVVVKIFQSQDSALANLMNGETDAFQLSDSASYDMIKRISCFRIYSALMPYYYIVGFNLANPLFQDRRVRQALNYAINRESIIRKVLKEKGIASAGTIPPYSWAFDARVKPFPHDTHKALELLAEAGWRDTDGDYILDKDDKLFEFQLCLPEGHDELEAVSLQIMDQLSNIGILVKAKKLPLEIMNNEYLFSRKFDAAFMYIYSGNDPDNNYQFWHSSQIGNGFNFFSYRNPRIDQLLDQGRIAIDQEQRKDIYWQYQAKMKEDPPGIFLFWQEYFLGVHKRFQGIQLSPYMGVSDGLRLWYISMDERHPDEKF
ncbi:MAG: ABC transporter substrate-binding protein [bacterium]